MAGRSDGLRQKKFQAIKKRPSWRRLHMHFTLKRDKKMQNKKKKKIVKNPLNRSRFWREQYLILHVFNLFIFFTKQRKFV